MKMNSMINYMLFSTIRLEAQLDNDVSVGTGFIVLYQRNEKQYPFIITNRHVIRDSKNVKFFFIKSDGKSPILGERFNIIIENTVGNWFYPKDDEIDVAIKPLAPLLEAIKEKNVTVYFEPIPLSLIPNSEQENQLTALEDVIFIGYPCGIYDSKNLLPIIRKGTTATPIFIDYEGKPIFLIDASVFRGSSGSPVFIFNEGSYSTPNGLCVGRRIHLLGILSRVLILNEKKDVAFEDIPTAQHSFIKTEQMLDLGFVIKSTMIVKTIEEFLAKVGEN
jgi:hypothetical protein